MSSFKPGIPGLIGQPFWVPIPVVWTNLPTKQGSAVMPVASSVSAAVVNAQVFAATGGQVSASTSSSPVNATMVDTRVMVSGVS